MAQNGSNDPNVIHVLDDVFPDMPTELLHNYKGRILEVMTLL